MPGKRSSLSEKAIEQPRHARMRRGAEIGLHILLQRPTGAGARGGTQPPHFSRTQLSPHLDAGVAMGQEPYTLAILFAERMGRFAFNNLRIDATDVESTGQFARMIEAGIYPKDELSRLPEGILDKYFEPNGEPGHFRVIDSIRQRVVFQRHDLLSFEEIGHAYSLVVCKNVLLHFLPRRGSRCCACSTGRWRRAAFSPLSRRRRCAGTRPLFQRLIADGQLSASWRAVNADLDAGKQRPGLHLRGVPGARGASRLDDVNTLVDVGQDPAILASIEQRLPESANGAWSRWC